MSTRRRPPTLPSRLASELHGLRDPRPPLHVLHVGKTGGTAVKHALLEHLDDSRLRLHLHGHDVTVAHLRPGERFAFVLRDPISRFVSAFNGRARADHPRYRYPWREEEREAFAIFQTPEQLASALTSAQEEERAAAERAMRGIGHLNTHYRYWFGDLQAFGRRLSDLFFIGFQERLEEDFELLKRKLGLPHDAHLPADPIVAHRSLGTKPDELSELGRANLERWYEEDFAFVAFCSELAPLVNVKEIPLRHSPYSVAARRPTRLRRIATRVVLPPLAGIAAFAATAAVVEALTDRDWSLSGIEWPADFITATVLVCLVPVVLAAVSKVLRLGRRETSSGENSRGEARKTTSPAP